MKNLLFKEFTLAASPLTYIFIAFSVMVFIPGYPILVGAFFVCLGIFYSFRNAREDGDVTYTALLPVRKSDVAVAKCLFSVTVEMISFLLCLIFAYIRSTVLVSVGPYRTNPMLPANFVYLGAVLVIFALFNSVFVSGFYKTAYRLGAPFIAFSVAAFAVITVAEALWHFPGLGFLGAVADGKMPIRALIFAICALFYIAVTLLSIKSSGRKFEKIDL